MTTSSISDAIDFDALTRHGYALIPIEMITPEQLANNGIYALMSIGQMTAKQVAEMDDPAITQKYEAA